MKEEKKNNMRLSWKLFLSHILIVLVGSMVLAIVAQIHAPTAFTHHIAHMNAMLGADTAMAEELRKSFLAAINEILLISGVFASLTAVLVSSFISWRITSPIRILMEASNKIAAGKYGERVSFIGNDELGQLANSFNRMADVLDKTETRRMELIGDLSHELKTPLTSIRSIMEGLVDKVLPPEEGTFIDVQREVARLQRLTSELSELSRAEAGKTPLQFELSDPNIVINRAVNRLQSQFEYKNIMLNIDSPNNLPFIEMDHERILQVLINLLGNALQYTERGGRVTVSCKLSESEIVISIADTGIGIESGNLPFIFDRFYRVDKSRARTRGGSGIGLTIASHLVHAHNGDLYAQSMGIGKGSTFTFSLPIKQK